MVGTVFVNFLSNALASYSPLMAVEVNTKFGELKHLNGKTADKASLGSIQFGSPRNIVIEHAGVN